MDRLAAMRVFVAVVDAQGFSAASRALSMPLPTVSRKIAELESQECADVRFWLKADYPTTSAPRPLIPQQATFRRRCLLSTRLLPLYPQLRTWVAPPANVSS